MYFIWSLLSLLSTFPPPFIENSSYLLPFQKIISHDLWFMPQNSLYLYMCFFFAIGAFKTWKLTNRGNYGSCVLGCDSTCSGRNLTPFQECTPSIFGIYIKWKQNVPGLHGVAFQKAVFFMFWSSVEIHVMQSHVYSSFDNTLSQGNSNLLKTYPQPQNSRHHKGEM